MKLIKPSIKFIAGRASAELIESAARTCYQSESKGEPAKKIVDKLIKSGHDAMLEFGWIFYKVICDRGVTHEIVRHRLFSYAQESTRYCNYSGGVTFINPPWFGAPEAEYHLGENIGDTATVPESRWLEALLNLEALYQDLINKWSWTPQQARSVLPNSLKTTINIAGNVREWRHFFNLRCSKKAHPQMQEVANMLLLDCKARFLNLFDDIYENETAK